MSFAPIGQAVDALGRGEMVVVVDDAQRENEGDLVAAAQTTSAHTINFMATYGRGLICVPMLPERLIELRLPLMVEEMTLDPRATPFTVSVDYREGTTTGISAYDRAATVRALVAPGTRPEDLRRPGHIFPLRYTTGGVLRRPGHTEASVDLVAQAGLYPSAVICEVMHSDGTMARLPELEVLARRHGLLMVTVADLIAFRRGAGEAHEPGHLLHLEEATGSA